MTTSTIQVMYFSPTGTTRHVVCGLATALADKMGGSTEVGQMDFTLPVARKEAVSFGSQDLVVFGVPVYAGRVPNVLLTYLDTIKGRGARAVPVVLFGNRHYDDALVELADILEAKGFSIVAGGAFVGEHSFSKTLGKGRPDGKDNDLVADFADKIATKLSGTAPASPVPLKGHRPYRPYYKPRNPDGVPVDIRKVVPKTSADCTDCKLCVTVCPMGSIDTEDVSKVNGICIKCGACVKACPVQAKYYDDENYLRHKHELEVGFADRKEPEFFV
ncbi:EFR1 family ferrodoxin [Desulfoluna spongiiphila]|uniref:4Fe-4S dicluster domain-containing protein n=1 Tax=Desulfoluna spongiiphila TaxID=419481 RepID=A0A1G5GSH3_9BACT|nr:EFR1 family ferrodoxin [Desulfoluna spongiiphila]SCY54535.1 4Fe-4S dicluster domain-containing protein [Desulfoluna spongiiphila]